ncbi:MAG: 4-alpha-glucanotransferase [Treponema sp.]|nr:4-alpha-glucanotransferase [Treponema sp.]
MTFTRKSGILLHPTSFYGKEGIGTLGKQAFTFIDWLSDADQTLWQILPLGPTGYGDSPYASFSTFAGNPLLIDLEKLAEKGWASTKDIKPADYIKSEGNVDFGAVVWWKMPVLEKCAQYFLQNASPSDKESYKKFCKEKSSWLENFSLFMSIKSFYDKKAAEEKPADSRWNFYWPEGLKNHDESALKEWKINPVHKSEIETYKVIQFFFNEQWSEVKNYANENGISIIGDIPIFVAPDSADVWANQNLFQLDSQSHPTSVAGVPPDYFCATGQLWGNPLYDWDAMKKTNYAWWISRIKRTLELTDCIRIDHFRGFESYWSVPANETTAINGKWVKGPGLDLFKSIKKKLGDIPIIAEDLGVITPEVANLRDAAGLPGMKVLQFAFSKDEIKEKGMSNYFLPHMYSTDQCIVYTGTHDNDTAQGWLELQDEETLSFIAAYISGQKLSTEKIRVMIKNGTLRNLMIKSVFASNACYAVIPFQDIAGYGNEGRMNTPATTGSNWAWRMKKSDLKKKDAETLSFLGNIYGRN